MDQRHQNAKISVWWDIENCPVPRNVDAQSVSSTIYSALRALNYNGTLSIFAYGDMTLVSHQVVKALNGTGLSLIHVTGGQDAIEMRIMVDMMLWANDIPGPSICMLIYSDGEYANLVQTLTRRGCHILLVHQNDSAHSFANLAYVRWLWTDLLAGGPPLAIQPNILNPPPEEGGAS